MIPGLPHLALLLTLQFTAPSFNAGDSCSVGLVPLDDLASIKVYGSRRWTMQESVLATIPAVGMEGMPFTVPIVLDHPDDIWIIGVAAVDKKGNESCQAVLELNMTLDAPCPPKIDRMPTVWYDIAGRKYKERPRSAGIYIEVRGKEKHKIAILH